MPATEPSGASLAYAEMFDAAFEFAPIGMALLDLDSVALRVNHAFCEMVGYAEREIRGTDSRRIVHPEDIDEDFDLREEMLSGAFPAYEREKRYVHRSGRVVWAQVSCCLVHDPDGNPSNFLLHVRDVTDRREAAEALARANGQLEERVAERTAELEETNRQLRAFAYSLAHDLRGPLASTDGFVRQLELVLGDKLEDKPRHYMSRVRAGVQTMSQLIDALLQLANLSQEPLQRTGVDLSAVARAWLERARERDRERTVVVEIAETPFVEGDPRLLKVLMDQLLDNAWKFTSRRDDARIAFRCEKDEGDGGDGRVHFCVHDNGAGFDPDYADKLFLPFQRLHPAHEFAGTGIGLAIVHRIAQRHGGRVWAEGKPGEGAVFRFTL